MSKEENNNNNNNVQWEQWQSSKRKKPHSYYSVKWLAGKYEKSAEVLEPQRILYLNVAI